jgi:hypothetical protein
MCHYYTIKVGERARAGRVGGDGGAGGGPVTRGAGREEERKGKRGSHKPFGKFHNRTCRICRDYFNIFDST